MNRICGLKLMTCGTSLALALVASPLQAQTHKHEPAGAAAHKLQLNQGKKWATDEPLRKGMSEIRALILANDEAIHKGKLTREGYAALGAKVEAQVAYMVANCKLDPQADANLHLVLAEVIAGADAMKGAEKKSAPRAGAGKVVAALNAYGRYFDHPGWTKL
jgi:hypothetical protein